MIGYMLMGWDKKFTLVEKSMVFSTNVKMA